MDGHPLELLPVCPCSQGTHVVFAAPPYLYMTLGDTDPRLGIYAQQNKIEDVENQKMLDAMRFFTAWHQ